MKKKEREFISKIYFSMSVQFIVYLIILLPLNFILTTSQKTFYTKNIYIAIIVIFLFIIPLFILSFLRQFSKKYNIGYFWFAIYTLSFGYLILFFILNFDPNNSIIFMVTATSEIITMTIFSYINKIKFRFVWGFCFGIIGYLIPSIIFLILYTSYYLLIIILLWLSILYILYLFFFVYIILDRYDYEDNFNIILGVSNYYTDVIFFLIYIILKGRKRMNDRNKTNQKNNITAINRVNSIIKKKRISIDNRENDAKDSLEKKELKIINNDSNSKK